MGFFKSIGKGLKNIGKSISANNLVKIASGNASAVVKEVINRAKDSAQMIVKDTITKSTKSAGNVAVKGSVLVKNNKLVKPLKAGAVNSQIQFKAVTKSVDESANKSADTDDDELVNYISDFWGRKIDKETGKLIQGALKEPVISSFLDRFKKEALKYYWWKYRPQFIVGTVAVVGFAIYWFKFRKKNVRRRR